MKPFSLTVIVALAITALAAGIAGAGDTKGPPCANMTAADETNYYRPTSSPQLQWVVILGAPACDSVTYTLDIYNFTGTTLLVDNLAPTGIAGNTVTFTYNFPSGTAPSDGVCLAGETLHKGRLADSAPDGDLCFPVASSSSGGGGGYH